MMRRARHLLATAPQYCCNNGVAHLPLHHQRSQGVGTCLAHIHDRDRDLCRRRRTHEPEGAEDLARGAEQQQQAFDDKNRR
jgi:hypothetical protein